MRQLNFQRFFMRKIFWLRVIITEYIALMVSNLQNFIAHTRTKIITIETPF